MGIYLHILHELMDLDRPWDEELVLKIVDLDMSMGIGRTLGSLVY